MADPSTLSSGALWLRAKDLGANNTSATGWVNQITGLAGQVRAPSATQPPLVKTSATPGGGKAVEWPAGYGMANPSDTAGTSLDFGPIMFTGTDVAAIYASSNYDEPAYAPSRVIDGSSSTEWLANSASPTLTVRLKSTKTVTAYTLTCTNNSRAPKTWTFQGSADGSSWTTLDTQTAQTFSGSTPRTFSFSNSTAYLYYRLNVSVNNESSTFTTIYEMSFTGATLAGTMATAGEIWAVVKAPSTNAALWQSSPDNAWFTNVGAGTIYESWGLGAGAGYTSQTPVVTVAATWRLYRIFTNGTTWTSTLDGTTQNTKSAAAFWRPHMIVGGGHYGNPLFGGGRIAEIYARTAVSTSGEVADLITYFNTEHGTSFPGGSSATVTVAAPVIAAVTDVLNPSVVSGVTVTAPLVTATTDVLNPTLSSGITVTAPLVTATTDLLDPTVTTPAGLTVAAPTLAAATDVLNPTLVSGVSVAAPAVTTTTALPAPSVVSPVTWTPITMDFTAGASLTIGSVVSVTPISMDFTAGASLNVVIPRGDNPDPRSGRSQWSYIVTDRAGNRYGRLGQVTADVIEDGINTDATTSITLAASDPKRALIPDVTVERECQVWRGKHLMHKGPILPGAPSDDGSTVTYSIPDARWYFSEDRRVIGRVPKRNLLKNGTFADGLRYWRGGFEPGTIPALPPLVAIVDNDNAISGKAIQIKGADKSQLTVEDVKTGAVFVPNSSSYLSGGEAVIQAVGANIPAGSTVSIVGHTANNSRNGDYGDGMALSLARANAAKATLLALDGTLSITTSGRGFYEPVATNSTDAGQALNRRVVITYEGTQSATGSAQYESQTLTVSQPASIGKPLTLTLVGTRDLTNWIGPNKPGYGVYIQCVKASAPTVIVDSAYSRLDEDSVRDSPQEDVATIEIPANGQNYIVEVRYYAPNGEIEWYDLELTPGDLLAFPNVDQALIVKGVVEHMQDTTKGKGNLGITTRTPLTGIKRPRWYPEYERQHVDSVLGEFTAMNRGLDLDVIPLPTGGDVVASYYPRQGGTSDMVLGPGVVVRFSPANTRDVASSIIAQADGSGSYRREAYASDPTALGGLMLERVLSAENETPVNELDDAARAELAAARLTTPAYWVECHPKHTNAILDRIAKGDRVRAILRSASTNVDSAARVVKRRIDPNTDSVSLMIALED